MPETFFNFAISLLIGLLIGIEREKHHREKIQPIGIRTFVLLSLFGTLLATLNQPFFSILASIFVFSSILFSYFRRTDVQNKEYIYGITTEISAALVFCLGYMLPTSPFQTITISALMLLILLERKRLHILAKKKFKPHEMEAAIILIIFTLGILPLLPRHTIDPWGIFNPRNFGILVATIAGLQFAGYVSLRLFGERFGMAITGLIGGFISSTIVFANLGKTLRNYPHSTWAIMSCGVLATVAMILEALILVFVASHDFFIYVVWPFLTMILIGLFFSVFFLHLQKTNHSELKLTHPIDLTSVLRFSLFIGITLIFITIAKRYVGSEGILIFSFLGGLFEVHGITIGTALLYLNQQLSLVLAGKTLFIAVAATFVSKLFLLWSLTPFRFALKMSLTLIGILSSGIVVYYLALT